MKRIVTFMMAIALILSLSVTAFADGGDGIGSITINNAVIDKTYSVFKIFDATYEGTSVTYSIAPGDEFFDDLFGDGTATNDYFEYHAATGVVTRKAGKTDPELFQYLGGLVKTATAVKSADATSDTVTITGLDTGYYVISRADGTDNGVSITTAKPNATVYDKNYLPGDPTKTSDKTTANVGDTINWNVTFTASNHDDGEKVLKYTIKDTLTPTGWAAINLDSIVIKVGGTTKTKDTDWKLVSGTANGFEIEIPWVDAAGEFLYDPTAIVEITYSATVQDAAANADPSATQLKNKAELEWDTETTPDVPGDPSETETEVYNLGFTKVDGTDTTKTLPGAVFKLYSDAACTTAVNVSPVDATNGLYIVDQDSGSNSVTTPANGQVVIQGLAAGTYYLKEETAPAGYNKLDAAVPVEVSASNGDELTVNSVVYKLNNAELNIQNFSGVELPSTGGEGTMMMITIGTMIAIAFAVLLITQKKMSVYQD